MSFNSIEFAIFLPFVFLIYWYVLRQYTRLQNIFLLIVSYLFYGWWDWRFLSLIIITTSSTYLTALLSQKHNKRLWTSFNVIINIGILIYFKYFNFFSDNFKEILSFFGMTADWVTLDILLPVGISFYTFQAIGYSIDVYKNKIKPTKDYIAFSTFIAFFPQLVAGPIESARNLLPQITKPRQWDYYEAVLGLRQILWGLVKKLAMADSCAIIVDHIFSMPDYYASQFGSSTLILGGILFSMQIYGDFSGYSDIAIGSARLFGIRLMTNFNYPYFSRNIKEFWQKWHISLMKWFHEYIYIPLGGNRKGKYRTLINICAVFLLSGLWHGAAWTFVIWGLWGAITMCIYRIISNNKREITHPTLKNIPSILIVFTITTIGFIIFRSPSIEFAYHYFELILSCGNIFTVPTGVTPLWIIAFVLIIEWLSRKSSFALQQMPSNVIVRFIIYWFLLGSILWTCETQSDSFIYFRF